MHSRNAHEISRRSIGVVRAGGFRNNVPIAKDCRILFTKKVGTAKNLVIMRKEFESRHFSGPNIDYIDEIPIPEPKRQNDDKTVKEEASNQQRKQDLHPSQRSKSKIAFKLFYRIFNSDLKNSIKFAIFLFFAILINPL